MNEDYRRGQREAMWAALLGSGIVLALGGLGVLIWCKANPSIRSSRRKGIRRSPATSSSGWTLWPMG